MQLEGVVQNGVIVPDRSGMISDGTRVAIIPLRASESTGGGFWDDLVELAREAEKTPCDLPADWAINHDRYLHGQSKRK